MAIAALESQQKVREIAGLMRLEQTVRWMDATGAADSSLPLVISAALAIESPAVLRSVLTERMRAGRHSLLLPRFRPGDLAHVLDAPAAIEVLTAEFAELNWNRESFRVPGNVMFRTKMHAGRWAVVDGRGAQVLAYQPTTARGRVVLCAASVTTARPGARVEDQQRLLAALLDACTGEPQPEVGTSKPAPTASLSAAEILSDHRNVGAGVLLAILAGAPANDAIAIVALARQLCRIQLDVDEVATLVGRLNMPHEEIEIALHQAGWTAFVRRCRRATAQP